MQGGYLVVILGWITMFVDSPRKKKEKGGEGRDKSRDQIKLISPYEFA